MRFLFILIHSEMCYFFRVWESVWAENLFLLLSPLSKCFYWILFEWNPISSSNPKSRRARRFTSPFAFISLILTFNAELLWIHRYTIPCHSPSHSQFALLLLLLRFHRFFFFLLLFVCIKIFHEWSYRRMKMMRIWIR